MSLFLSFGDTFDGYVVEGDRSGEARRAAQGDESSLSQVLWQATHKAPLKAWWSRDFFKAVSAVCFCL